MLPCGGLHAASRRITCRLAADYIPPCGGFFADLPKFIEFFEKSPKTCNEMPKNPSLVYEGDSC
jgi:hypothetical protein